MKKIVVAALAMLLVVASALCFASCGQKIVEVEKTVEVPVETPVEVEVEKTTTEINGIAVTGDYAVQTKTGELIVIIAYVDMVLNPDYNPTEEEGDLNPRYVKGDAITTATFTVGYTYKVLIFGGATYLPELPDAEKLVTYTDFYAKNGDFLYKTDADHTIAAAEYVDTETIPTAVKTGLTLDYGYVTFDFAD